MNNKFIKTKQNHKLKFKYFEPFWVLHLIENQAYKLELPSTLKICDVFYEFLLEQNTIKKGQVDEKIMQLEFDDYNKNQEYDVKVICNNLLYAKELESAQLPSL